MAGALAAAEPLGVFTVALGASAVAFAFLAALGVLHRRRLSRLPIRIHVAGSRGKSTTTRLIAAGLRASGRRTLARTTGTRPRLILADGSERSWRRWGAPGIGEIGRVVAAAARVGAEALVLECMAIRPELVAAAERHLVRATHVVVTNARLDHLEDLGDDSGAVAAALAGAVPTRGRLFATDEAALSPLIERARAQGTTVEVVDTKGLSSLEADRRLALAVCRSLGVAETVAAAAMETAAKDPGAFSITTVERGGKRVRFANAFACNDVASLAKLWAEHGPGLGPPAVVLLNTRQDRPLRTRQFLEFLASVEPPVALYLAGGGWTRRRALAAGLAPGRTRVLGGRDPETALRALVEACPPQGAIWGVGNYRGLGEALTEVVAGATRPC